MTWQSLGATAPTDLVEARLGLHYAAQVVAAAGITLIAPEPDDSHPNLGWDESHGSLVGRSLNDRGLKAGLRIADPSLLLLDAEDRVVNELALAGHTLEDGHVWLAEALTGAGVTLPADGITPATYALPDHPIAHGAAFSSASNKAASEGARELARWFANGHEALTALAARVPGASEVRCWPHHFDLGSLAVVATDAEGGLAKSIGLGLSPGDEGYAEPYWYVSPWPYPDADALPALGGGGHWHTEGYTSAILLGSDLIAGPSEAQADRLHAFLDSAVDTSRRILSR